MSCKKTLNSAALLLSGLIVTSPASLPARLSTSVADIFDDVCDLKEQHESPRPESGQGLDDLAEAIYQKQREHIKAEQKNARNILNVTPRREDEIYTFDSLS